MTVVVVVEDVDGRSEEEDEDAIVSVTQKLAQQNGRSQACNLAEVAIPITTSPIQNDALPKRVLSETRSLPSRRLPHTHHHPTSTTHTHHQIPHNGTPSVY